MGLEETLLSPGGAVRAGARLPRLGRRAGVVRASAFATPWPRRRTGSVTAGRFGIVTALGFVAFAYLGGITTVSGAVLGGMLVTEGLVIHAVYRWFGVPVAKATSDGATGDDVPQVYLGPSPSAAAGVQQAVRKLVQFDRVTLRPGEQRRLTLHVDARELSNWSTAQQRWIRGTGRRDIYLGTSSCDIREHASLRI